MEKEEFIAHVRQNEAGSWEKPHLLKEHLDGTAKLAGLYAAKFKSEEWGRMLGLLHDAGKGRISWQEYLRKKSGYGYDVEAHLEEKKGKIPHAIHGAKIAEEVFPRGGGRILAYCIAGHHAGLPDWSGAEGAGQASLDFQESQIKSLDDIHPDVIASAVTESLQSIPWKFSQGLDLSLWIRMLFSCLVDADFLDTEMYMDEQKAKNRGNYCAMGELWKRYNEFIRNLDENAQDIPINKIRRHIRDRCLTAAEKPQGVFSLSVPTGGGKTLSGLGFALKHAVQHNLERVIYVIPYNSIIEQNADVFRTVVGTDQVIEHHSNLDEEAISVQARLAAENWDAPVVVTTSVQFFESLFSAKTSRCRKLHNLVNAVVVLDEAQLVPVDFLEPILEAMQLLVEHYQVSFVLSTATQPALGYRMVGDKEFKGFKRITEIMGTKEEVLNLYDSLKRVTLIVPEQLHDQLSWEELARDLIQYRQVLCIVSDRKSCRELYGLMPPNTIHLSALMCGQHRSETISLIKGKLKNNEPIRVVTTQLVEAGVDIDFPIVYRAIAGLDSIAQAAGRCNREGRLPEKGKVIVFNPYKQVPRGLLRKGADIARSILNERHKDPLHYDLFERYFQEWYWKANSLDSKNIIKLLSAGQRECDIYFRTAADRFKMIDDSQQKNILVRYGDGVQLIELLKIKEPDRVLMRKLQRYSVMVYNHEFDEMLSRGSIEEVYPNIYALTSEMEYSQEIGLVVSPVLYNPEDLIIG